MQNVACDKQSVGDGDAYTVAVLKVPLPYGRHRAANLHARERHHVDGNDSERAQDLRENKLGRRVLDFSDINTHSGALAQRLSRHAGQRREGSSRAAGCSDCRSAMHEGGLACRGRTVSDG